MTAILRVELPLKLPSAGNLHEHWRTRHARIKAQRAAVRMALRTKAGMGLGIGLAVAARLGVLLIVTLTRISPRKLDGDNLQFAFKGVRDEVAAALGIDDGSDAVSWRYAQESGKASIRIEIARAKP